MDRTLETLRVILDDIRSEEAAFWKEFGGERQYYDTLADKQKDDGAAVKWYLDNLEWDFEHFDDILPPLEEAVEIMKDAVSERDFQKKLQRIRKGEPYE